MKSQIRDYFRQNEGEIRKKMLSLLADLISVKTINAGKANLKDYPFMKVPGEESKAIEVLKRYFDKNGLQYSVYEKVEGRGNLISTYGKGKKSLCVGVHLDVVPAGDPKLWNTDPFVMTEKDGFVYGRGVLDNKGPMVSCIMAMEVLKKLEIKLNGEFILAAIAGEECHEIGETEPGIEFLIEEGYLKPTYAIIPDIGGDMKKIDIAEKGVLRFKVTSFGKQAHGSTPEKGVNAINKMAQFIANAEKLKLSFKPHDILIKPTVNLGVIKGGAAPNIVPDTCEAVFDVRYLPSQNAEGILNEFKACTKGIDDVRFEFEITDNDPPHEINPDNELVKTIQMNAETVLGFKPETIGMGGKTFAKTFNLGGIQAVGFGPGDEDAFHVSNEYLEIKQMIKFAELLACISVDLLK